MAPRRPKSLQTLPLFLVAGVFLGVFMASPASAQYFGRNKIQYEQFDWHTLETEHLDVYYYPEMQEIAENGAYFAEEIYEELENRFDFSLNHRVPIIFYSSNLHFKQTNITPGFIPDGVGGFFEFLKGRVVIPANGNIHQFRRVIRHELVHVFTYSKLTRVLRDHRQPVDRLLPLWFTEGLAEYWSGEPDHQHEMIMRDAIASNFFVPLQNLNRIAGSFVMYKEGEALCRFVAEEYGEERILALIENAWRDTDFHKVMEFVLHEEFETISNKWTAWVREQYLPDLEDADIPSLVAEAVAARGFNMKPVVYERHDGSQEVIYLANVSGYTNVYSMPVDEDFQPLGDPEIIIRGERSVEYEAFHLFESRMDVSETGLLAFVTKRGERDVVHVYNLESRQREDTFHFENLVAVYSPTWSPDARQVAFTGIDSGGLGDLFVFDRDSKQLRRLTRDSYDDRDPDWSPDGRYLVFSSDRTATGHDGSHNLFTYDFATDAIQYVTYGSHQDMSPRWSPDGSQVVFISSRRESDGKFSGQDIWVADMTRDPGEARPLAAVDSLELTSSQLGDPDESRREEHSEPEAEEIEIPGGSVAERQFPASVLEHGARADASQPSDSLMGYARPLHQLTSFTSAAYDPVWTSRDRLIFSTFEDFRFTIRQLQIDSLLVSPRSTMLSTVPRERDLWSYERIAIEDTTQRVRYRPKYALDIAQGGVSTNPVLGTSGGAVVSFSDIMGDD
ncbi:MAG: DPP IV N-terminal domain-containing protein, partial [Rubricoccaceae bacterium]|nr:DPP IV N-terminal domain-containing protein [Rubricoccaceae bacterium]